MRLRTCIALELGVAGAFVSSLGVSVAWAMEWIAPEARAAVAVHGGEPPAPPPAVVPVAATADPIAAPAPAPAPPVELAVLVGPPTGRPPAEPAVASAEPDAPPTTAFDPRSDDGLLAPLRDAALIGSKFNRGGSSISLRLDFEGGGRAAFKPEQVAWQSMPRKEIAAYRIDRLLGLGAVPPALGRRFPVEDIYARMAEGSRETLPRLRAEMVTHAVPAAGETRMVAGAVSWWIPTIRNARIRGYDIDTTDGIVVWRRQLRAGADIPAESYDLVRQISNMLLFDFLIDNVDRWSGSNAKVDPTGAKLYFMDNTMAFTRDRTGHSKGRTYLERTQVFSRRLVARLRALTAEEVHTALAPDADSGPFEPLLSGAEIDAVLGRRQVVLRYVDELIAEHGEAAVLAFP